MSLPNDMIQVFRELISANYRNGQSIVYTRDVVKRIEEIPGKFVINWFNVEIFFQTWWNVTVCDPGKDDAYFTFTEKE